jgi:exodeoxyribonuclease X
MRTFLIDTECTGLKEPQPIEVAWMGLQDDLKQAHAAPHTQRYKPSKPIDYGAMAMHHITMDDLEDCLPVAQLEIPPGMEYMVGHNVDYDWDALGKPEVKRICTLALARFAWPDLDSHSLGALMYFLKGPEAKAYVVGAHSAHADVVMNLYVLVALVAALNITGVEYAWQISERARVPTVMSFGKHKGSKIAEIPRDYKEWALRQPDFDPYVLQAFRETM